jgi:hypothetical protein
MFCFENSDFENLNLFRISPAFAEAASRRQVLRILAKWRSKGHEGGY